MNPPVANIPSEAAAWLIGRYDKSVDEKSRLVIPSSFRKVLASRELILTRWFDGALALFPADVWRRMAEAINDMPLDTAGQRNMRLTFFSSAVPQFMDSQGRIVLGEEMKDYAGIESDAVLLGDWDRLQIWAHYRYKDFRKKNDVFLDEQYEDVLARVATGESPRTSVEQPSKAVTTVAPPGDHDNQAPTENDET